MSFFTILFSQWTLAIIALIYIFYKWCTATYGCFEEKGIPFVKPVPFFGNFMNMLLQRESLNDTVYNLYMKFQNKKLYGYYQLRTPMIAIRDPDLIKKITIKDFDHFADHRTILDEQTEPLFGRSLFMLTGQKWRDMRATLSPAFTSSKMRTMFQLIIDCAEESTKFILKEAKHSTTAFVPEIKELFTRVTNDVIASTAFGIQVNSLTNQENEFYLMGKRVTNFSGLASVRFLLISTIPRICKFFKITLFSTECTKFFRSIVQDTMNFREKNSVVRPDMIHLLMQAKSGSLLESINDLIDEKEGFATVKETNSNELKSMKKRHWEDDDLTAQCMIFFVAGFDSVATLMCFTIYELTINSDVQKKLISEIDAVRKQLNEKSLTYDNIQNMKYMDMVVSESLRKWPPAVGTDRICVKPYTIENDENGTNILINKDDNLFIPIYGIHRDPNNYPNPEEFDPERFNDENKNNIRPFTYLPFGTGPRNCIGSRFALMECKAILFYLLSSLKFEISEKTQIPLKLAKSGFNVKAEKGFYIHFKPRF